MPMVHGHFYRMLSGMLCFKPERRERLFFEKVCMAKSILTRFNFGSQTFESVKPRIKLTLRMK